VFISTLGRLNEINASSSFNIISKLKKQCISEYSEHKLMYAVAVACEIRLRWYMLCKQQNNYIEKHKDQDASEILLNLVGANSIFSYYKIAYALQCDISKQLDLKRKHFFFKPTTISY